MRPDAAGEEQFPRRNGAVLPIGQAIAFDGTREGRAEPDARHSPPGGSATLVIGGEEHVCAAGGSFTVVDTTFTCTEVGDESIVLDTVRTG